MRRIVVTVLLAGAWIGASTPALAQTSGAYELVSNWAKLPAGMYFGMKEQPPYRTRAERDADAARPRPPQTAVPQATPSQSAAGPGISGIAVGSDDRVYVFNRGIPQVIVFNPDGTLSMSGGALQLKDKNLGTALHSGTVDWDGNVWVIERDAHRIVKLTPNLQTFLMQLGTAGERGNDAMHFNLPSGIVVLHNGNLVVTDGYGNNRLVMFSKDGALLKQVAKGAGGPEDKGSDAREWTLPHKVAIDAADNVYAIDREGKRIQVFDKNLNYLRTVSNPGWNPWDIAISRKGNDGFGYIADHTGERLLKISLTDGKILAAWGQPGQGPGEFDWLHGVAVDSKGAVYGADTWGQRIQKFVPRATPPTGR
jgi:sugar lactone lactonase YvrE